MSDVEVRVFTERDRHELRELFGRAGQGAPSASLWGHEQSEADVYLVPYMDLAPESLLVASRTGTSSATWPAARTVPSFQVRPNG